MAAPISSLSSVVSKLTRASLGASVSASVKDEDLDRYVAELIMKEAKQSEERYKGKDGIRAYLPRSGFSEVNVPKPNKRFLHQIIRNTDDHNTAVLQAQARAAEEVRAQREEAERAERRARAVEASQVRIRRLMGDASRRSPDRDVPRFSRSPRRRRSTSRDHTDWRDRDDSEYDDRDRSYAQSSRKRRREHGNDTYYYSKSRTSRNHSSSRHASATRETRHSPEYASGVGRSSRLTPSPPVTHEPEVDRRIESGFTKDDAISTENMARREEGGRGSSSSSSSCERPYRSKRRRDRSESPLARSSGRTPPRSESPGHSRDDNDGEERRSRKSSRHPERESKKRSRHEHRSEREAEKKKKKYKTSAEQDIHGGDTSTARLPVHSSKMDKYFDPAYDPALDYTPALDNNAVVQEGAFDSWNTMLQLIRVRKEDKEAKKRGEKEGLGACSSSKRPPGLTDIVYKKRGTVREWDLGKD